MRRTPTAHTAFARTLGWLTMTSACRYNLIPALASHPSYETPIRAGSGHHHKRPTHRPGAERCAQP